MPGARVVLQAGEDPPAVEVVQVDVQGDGIKLVLARDGQRIRAARGDASLEPAFVRHFQQETGEVRVVFHDQQGPVLRLDVVAIVVELHGGGGGRFGRVGRQAQIVREDDQVLGGGERRLAFQGFDGHVILRQIERERAALSGSARQADFTAQQARDFAADGQSEPGAAVLPAGAAVRLLEGLENDLLLVGGDADAGVSD